MPWRFLYIPANAYFVPHLNGGQKSELQKSGEIFVDRSHDALGHRQLDREETCSGGSSKASVVRLRLPSPLTPFRIHLPNPPPPPSLLPAVAATLLSTNAFSPQPGNRLSSNQYGKSAPEKTSKRRKSGTCREQKRHGITLKPGREGRNCWIGLGARVGS